MIQFIVVMVIASFAKLLCLDNIAGCFSSNICSASSTDVKDSVHILDFGAMLLLDDFRSRAFISGAYASIWVVLIITISPCFSSATDGHLASGLNVGGVGRQLQMFLSSVIEIWRSVFSNFALMVRLAKTILKIG